MHPLTKYFDDRALKPNLSKVSKATATDTLIDDKNEEKLGLLHYDSLNPEYKNLEFKKSSSKREDKDQNNYEKLVKIHEGYQATFDSIFQTYKEALE